MSAQYVPWMRQSALPISCFFPTGRKMLSIRRLAISVRIKSHWRFRVACLARLPVHRATNEGISVLRWSLMQERRAGSCPFSTNCRAIPRPRKPPRVTKVMPTPFGIIVHRSQAPGLRLPDCFLIYFFLFAVSDLFLFLECFVNYGRSHVWLLCAAPSLFVHGQFE